MTNDQGLVVGVLACTGNSLGGVRVWQSCQTGPETSYSGPKAQPGRHTRQELLEVPLPGLSMIAGCAIHPGGRLVSLQCANGRLFHLTVPAAPGEEPDVAAAYPPLLFDPSVLPASRRPPAPLGSGFGLSLGPFGLLLLALTEDRECKIRMLKGASRMLEDLTFVAHLRTFRGFGQGLPDALAAGGSERARLVRALAAARSGGLTPRGLWEMSVALRVPDESAADPELTEWVLGELEAPLDQRAGQPLESWQPEEVRGLRTAVALRHLLRLTGESEGEGAERLRAAELLLAQRHVLRLLAGEEEERGGWAGSRPLEERLLTRALAADWAEGCVRDHGNPDRHLMALRELEASGGVERATPTDPREDRILLCRVLRMPRGRASRSRPLRPGWRRPSQLWFLPGSGGSGIPPYSWAQGASTRSSRPGPRARRDPCPAARSHCSPAPAAPSPWPPAPHAPAATAGGSSGTRTDCPALRPASFVGSTWHPALSPTAASCPPCSVRLASNCNNPTGVALPYIWCLRRLRKRGDGARWTRTWPATRRYMQQETFGASTRLTGDRKKGGGPRRGRC